MSSEDRDTVERCVDLARRFCLAADAGDAAAVGTLFAEDCTFQRAELTLNGRADLETMVRGRPTGMVTRHCLTTSRVEILDQATASGVHYCLVFARKEGEDQGPPIVREYRDSYVRGNDGWRISGRIVLTPFAA